MKPSKLAKRAERQELQANMLNYLREIKNYSKGKAKHYSRCTVDKLFSQK